MAADDERGGGRVAPPWWIAVLLRLYPRGYRDRYGDELAPAMQACLVRERLNGANRALTILRIAGDAVGSAMLARRHRALNTTHAALSTGDSLMPSLLFDVRHALRMLRRAPMFSALVIATLALVIGANTAIFSVVNGVLLRGLPYRQPGRLVALYEGIASRPTPFGFSAPDLAAFRERVRSYEALGAFRTVEFELSGVTQPERVTAARITASLAGVLGVGPALGRGFTEAEDTGRQPVAILSDGLWRRAFGADPAIVGKPLSLDRRPYTIVGVMPRGFTFPNRGPHINNVPADLFVPMSFSPGQLAAFGANFNNSVIGRLKPGVTIEQARSEAAAALKQIIAEVYPATLRDIPLVVTTTPMRDDVVGRVERVLLVLLAAVGVLVLIACADIACLMLTRAAGRAREIAIRTALGARRGRVVRLMLVETGMLAAIGAGVGLALSWIAQRGLLTSVAADLPRAEEIGIDGRVLAFTAIIALAVALFCGLLPAFEASGADSSGALKEGSRGATPGVRQRRILSGLVALQFACAIVLLASGLLLIRSFAKAMGTNPGFRSDHVVSIATSLPVRGYPDGPAVRAFYSTLLERVAAIPGAAEVGAATDLPLTVRDRRAFTIENPSPAALRLPQAVANDYVLGRYFEALGARIVRGRALAASDTLASEPVVVINETLATGYWPGEDAVGRRIAWGGPQTHLPWMRIVGVVADIKQSGLTGRTEPQTWLPWTQVSDTALANNGAGIFRGIKLMVRTNVAPLSLVSGIREEVRRLDPALPVTGVQTLDDVVGASAAAQRFNAVLLGAFAAAALLLASVGIGGVLAITVSRRTPEIGIRLALGADAGTVVRMVIRQGMTLVAAGLAIGLPCAFAAARLLRALLFETTPYDGFSFAAATLVLCAVALVACAAPAIRASRVSPVTALRID